MVCSMVKKGLIGAVARCRGIVPGFRHACTQLHEDGRITRSAGRQGRGSAAV